ncbi:purine and uridine phosphorylase, partial [Aureobasidium sp. EXF-3399]
MPDPEEYTIGWICALPTEHTAACLFLDEEHGQPDPDHIAAGDNNAYELGVMAGHKVVIAVLPHGEYGTSTAATVVTDMLRSFTNVKVGLMVGVGGGAPTSDNDIRLGDVVVSSPKDGNGGVYQYDYGKRIQGHDFKPTGHLNQPPSAVLTAMALLVSRYERKGNQIGQAVDEILEENPRLRTKYGRPEVDILYASNFVHPHGDDRRNCEEYCETKPPNIVNRLPRDEDQDDPAVHFGTIASGNSLMKDALIRDSLASEGVLCFEMEAAGLANRFPCLVVRGICDYSDSHKNKRWQGYAAMTAAAYAKDLLKVMLPRRVESEKRLTAVLESLDSKTASIQTILQSTQQQQQAQHLRTWLSPSDPSVNLEKALKQRHQNTCRWLLDDDGYRSWRTTPSSFFWLHGLSGCGKTVLASAAIHQLQSEGSSSLVAFHYFDVNGGDRRGLSQMLRSLLYQLSSKHPQARQTLQELYYDCDKGARKPTARQLSEQFVKILDQVAEVIVIVDALDECNSPDDVVSWLKELYQTDRKGLHLLVTSRKQGILNTTIEKWHEQDQLHAVRSSETNKDIANYIHARLSGSEEFERWNPHKDLREHVEKAVLQRANGMFRLAASDGSSAHPTHDAAGNLRTNFGYTTKQ